MSMFRGFKKFIFNQSTAAQFLIVDPPPADKRIRVRGVLLSSAGAQDATFETDAVSMGAANLSANYTLNLPPTDGGIGEAWFQCEKGEPLNITLGQAVQTDGVIYYDVTN